MGREDQTVPYPETGSRIPLYGLAFKTLGELARVLCETHFSLASGTEAIPLLDRKQASLEITTGKNPSSAAVFVQPFHFVKLRANRPSRCGCTHLTLFVLGHSPPEIHCRADVQLSVRR